MPLPLCTSCSTVIELDVKTYWNYQGEIRCPHCTDKMSVVFASGELLSSRPQVDPKFTIWDTSTIPEQVLGDYNEALVCLTHQCWKASAVMARRSIQGALLAKGTAEDSPGKMIIEARKMNALTDKAANLATTVTFFGNKGGHPQETEINNVGEIEANNGLWVTKELLVALFPPPRPAVPAGASAPSA